MAVLAEGLVKKVVSALKPVYVTDPNLVDVPLTEVPNQWVPQQGIHLYHFPLSLDSQKVRQGLEELGVQWSRVGRKVVLPTVRYKLLKALGHKQDI